MSAPQHRARLTFDVTALDGSARPERGPVAILPVGDDELTQELVSAVEDAGAAVEPLSERTRGLVFLEYGRVHELAGLLDAHPRIGWVQLPFAGIDVFADALRPAAERGVLFTSARGAYAEPVAEHALMLTLALLREAPMRVRATSWGPKAGRSLYGADVVVIGAGGIAASYLDLVRPFRVRTTVVRRSAADVPGADRTLPSDRLDEALETADVVMIAAAATEETRGLLGRERFARLPRGAVLVNVARGSLVDADALVDAVREGRLGGAGLDVTDPEPLPEGHPLWTAGNVIVTPHSADTPDIVRPLLHGRIVRNVEAFVSTGRFVGIADPRRGY